MSGSIASGSIASSLAPELQAAQRACRGALVGVALASGLVNLLMLTGPLFMLQVYDRVLPSRSIPTLVGLALLALTLFAFQGLLDALRGRVLLRIGRSLEERLSPRLFDVAMRASLECNTLEGLQALRDLDNVRALHANIGLTALFDLPWAPLYIVVCFLFHPWLGAVVLIGALLLCLPALATVLMSREPSRDVAALAGQRHALVEAASRHAAVVQALGMRQRMAERWGGANASYLDRQQRLSDIVADLGSLSRALRLVLQSCILGTGAFLVINQEATTGVILAATILGSRALAPVELAIANGRNFLAARASWHRLSDILLERPIEPERTPIPAPRRSLQVTAVSLAAPQGRATVLHDVTFTLAAGRALGVIGPSGSGKSSLARALVGVWKPARGVIRLDGATLDQWPSEILGKDIGYLPQEVQLFAGTVAENIARFEPRVDPGRLLAAAQAAGVHETILRLPNGYETEVGDGGLQLSGGQRQRIALARALYGDPFLVVLDEPTSNLDAPGEQAFLHAIASVRARGGIIVVISHRPHAVMSVDDVLVLNEGRVHAYGRREDIVPGPGSVTTPGAPVESPPAARKQPTLPEQRPRGPKVVS